jgi:hypothetical protein
MRDNYSPGPVLRFAQKRILPHVERFEQQREAHAQDVKRQGLYIVLVIHKRLELETRVI